jgi:hypothetical protein
VDIADPDPEFIEQLKNLEDVDHISSQTARSDREEWRVFHTSHL